MSSPNSDLNSARRSHVICDAAHADPCTASREATAVRISGSLDPLMSTKPEEGNWRCALIVSRTPFGDKSRQGA